ncbi:uncharacterized protein LOC130696368 [Daphnia carinata]|uniref:uncharacterized protein LOC130696368 n=1 Tax=Daphnia carinata TaxID=120202 RepID=UPI00257EBF04|nr:uncharacterized protein LOC130696368 [Daphnia carinata]
MADMLLIERARGGGSGGYGGGGYGASEYGNDYVDPYVVLASLGFGVFLFNIVYNLLNRSARSVDVSDMNLPLQLSDRPEELHNLLENATNYYQEEPWAKQSWSDDDPSPSSTSKSSHRLLLLKESVRVGQRVADAIRRHPASCPKTLLCNLSNDAIAWSRQPAIALRAMQLYITSLAHHYGQEDTARYVDQVENDVVQEKFDSNQDCDYNSNGPSESDCGLSDLMALF